MLGKIQTYARTHTHKVRLVRQLVAPNFTVARAHTHSKRVCEGGQAVHCSSGVWCVVSRDGVLYLGRCHATL